MFTSSSVLVSIKNNQSKPPPELPGDSEPEPELEELELELLELELELEELELDELELEELELDVPHEEGFSGISSAKVRCSGATRIGSSPCVL